MRVYADHAATTKLHKGVLEAMIPVFQEDYGNPSSVHRLGQEAAGILSMAREQIANSLGCTPRELTFTGGGTEADLQAILSGTRAGAAQGRRHVITTAFEHHAVLKPMQKLMREGFDVTFLPVPEDGILQPLELEKAIRPDTCFVSVMMANNEIGTIQPIREMAEICRNRQILFHTDAVQAVGHIPVDLRKLGVDYLSASAHKFGGPKGIGFLYTRQGAFLSSVMEGGEQERGKRAGTENVAGTVGMAKALEIATANMQESMDYVSGLRDRLISGIKEQIPNAFINGDLERRLPGNVNVTIEGIEADTMLILLDSKGICASAGAACSAGATEPSHVLTALGLSPKAVAASLRFSLGEDNTEEEVDYLLEVLRTQTEKLRNGRKI